MPLTLFKPLFPPVVFSAGLLDEVTNLLLSGTLLPSHPAGRSIGYRQTLDYLLRPRYSPSDEDALANFVHSFAAASRRYAQQQTKWFRSERDFEWVPVDWAAPEVAERAVLSAIQRTRAEHEAALKAETQSELRAVKLEEGREMRTYREKHPILDDPDARRELILRADNCCERLQPMLEQIAAADNIIAERYPWHVGGDVSKEDKTIGDIRRREEEGTAAMGVKKRATSIIDGTEHTS